MSHRHPSHRVIAEQWTGHACTLNGEPAVVSGRMNRFATVAALTGPTRADYAWETVQRIMLAGGNFKA